MKIVNGDNFCSEEKYKLYRTVYEILHPTISKKNISNYKVVFDETLLPTLVFYPKRISNMNSVIIMIPGYGMVNNSFGKYSDICKKLALESEKLVIAIDYFGSNIKYPTTGNKVYKIVNYLYDELEKNGINSDSISIMCDSTGCVILNKVLGRLKKKNKKFNKLVMLYPVCRKDYSNYIWNDKSLSVNFNLDKKINNYLHKYYSKGSDKDIDLLDNELVKEFSNKLVITGDMDILKDDGLLLAEKIDAKYLNIKFASHGFLSCNDSEITTEVFKEIKEFL